MRFPPTSITSVSGSAESPRLAVTPFIFTSPLLIMRSPALRDASPDAEIIFCIRSFIIYTYSSVPIFASGTAYTILVSAAKVPFMNTVSLPA